MTTASRAKNAILLAMFGTSAEHGLPALLHIRDRVSARYPRTEVRMSFTSGIIRRIWHERAADSEYRGVRPRIPESIYAIQDPAREAAKLASDGFGALVVQPVHIAPDEEVRGEEPLTDRFGLSGKNSSTVLSFNALAFGRPALGSPGSTYPLRDDIVTVARSLAQDLALARQHQAAMYYMGHGNRSDATDRVYAELVQEIRRQYPDILTVMSLVEGSPTAAETVAEIKAARIRRVVLKPFMIVAGDHVRKNMVGDGPATLQSCLEKEGLKVHPIMTGLGEQSDFADIFAQHAADAARDAGIMLG